MWLIVCFKLFFIFHPHTTVIAQQGNICINRGETTHSLHSFIFDSDRGHLGTDYSKEHTSLSFPFFLEPKKYIRKLGGTFPNVTCFQWKRPHTLTGAKFLGIKCWYSFLDWKLHSYSSWEPGLRYAWVERCWVSWFHSPGDFKQKFSFWTCCFSSVSLSSILHSGYICVGNLTHSGIPKGAREQPMPKWNISTWLQN